MYHHRTVALSLAKRRGPSIVTQTVARCALICGTTQQLLAKMQVDRRAFSAKTAMFCRQCEQTQEGVGCTTLGVCGKTPETAAAQDALMETIKCVSAWCVAARQTHAITPKELQEANEWTLKAAFSTLTNVNFSDERIVEYIHQGMVLKGKLQQLIQDKGGEAPKEEVSELTLSEDMTVADMEEFGLSVSIPVRKERMGNDDCFSLNEIATYGCKGTSAYAAHCLRLGSMNEQVMSTIHEVWTKLASDEPDMDGLLASVMKIGETNWKVMGMLDEAHVSRFGNPEPSPVRTTAIEGKAILISGHDLADLEALLEQTKDKGIHVYTHGEMLPAHAYPKFKQYPHLVGNYGTAWQNQKIEFASFPGPIVVTTNCVLEPRRVYKNRIFTMNEAGVDGVKHISTDFTPVVEMAQQKGGFKRTVPREEFHTTGFNQAGEILDAIKAGHVSRIFLIGGCDGTQWDRNYFTDLAEATPDDSIILTLGCAKNRIIHSDKLRNATLPNVGLPRVIDMGQCNDSFSAIVLATELAKALDCDPNDLPLSLALSHLEQKAVAVLLTLLNLGVKNIRLGPSLPAYITPNVLNVLVKNYNIMPTSADARKDLKAMMAGN